MDYTRPDDINETLSASLVKEKRGLSPWLILITVLLLIMLGLFAYYFLIYKKQALIKVPIYTGGTLATSTAHINPRPVSTSTTSTSNTNSTSTIVIPGIEKLFYTIWPDAITGYTFNKAGNIIFQDKATGHIYEADAPDYKPYKIANTTINNLHLSFFANDGKTIIFQTLNQNNNTLSTYIADIANYNNLPSNLYNNAYLGDKVYDISISPDKMSAIYVYEDNKKYNSNIYILNIKTRETKLVYSYPLPHMRLQYYSTDTVSVYQNTGENIISQTYILNIKNSNLVPILKGEQLISNISGGGYLYSNRDGLFLQNKKLTNKFSFYTTANKCVWSHTSTYVLCGVNENYSSDNLDESLDQSKVYADNLYIHGIDYTNERAIYDFISFDKTPVHIQNMSISDDNEKLAIMDQERGLYMLKIYSILSSEPQ